ncbi:MAG: PIN domain-containing protein [Candidatus Nitrosopolaris sp.]
MIESQIYVDAMIWIAAFDPAHTAHIRATQILQRISHPYNSNRLFLSDHVLSEIFAYVTRKQKNEGYTEDQRVNFVTDSYDGIYNARNVKILYVKDTNMGTGIEYIKQYPKIPASLSDWLSLILMVEYDIRVIQTFDRDFRKVTNQVPSFRHIKIWTA